MVSYISSINASQNYTNKSTIKSMKRAKMITRHSKRETLLGWLSKKFPKSCCYSNEQKILLRAANRKALHREKPYNSAYCCRKVVHGEKPQQDVLVRRNIFTDEIVNVNIYDMLSHDFIMPSVVLKTCQMSFCKSFVLALLKTDAIEFLVKSQEFSEVLN